MKSLKKEEKETDIICDQCGKPMLLRWSKNGEYLVCSGKPDCKNKKNVKIGDNGKISVVEQEIKGICQKCGGNLIEKRGRFGRFFACSNYPECKYTEPYSLGFHCPEEGCTGKLVDKTSKKKKRFISCSKYPTCTFAQIKTDGRCLSGLWSTNAVFLQKETSVSGRIADGNQSNRRRSCGVKQPTDSAEGIDVASIDETDIFYTGTQNITLPNCLSNSMKSKDLTNAQVFLKKRCLFSALSLSVLPVRQQYREVKPLLWIEKDLPYRSPTRSKAIPAFELSGKKWRRSLPGRL
jgi:ssDNA-binding Zn-finger/Zn-ribbon topoisomerase 1